MTNTGSSMDRRKLLGLLLPVSLYAQSAAPYLDKSRTPRDYAGPGREEAPAANSNAALIGFFGPGDAAHPQGGAIWMGASLSVEDANRAGGCNGKPFKLVSRWADDPWRAGASAVVKLAYQDKVLAILGGIDGATTHLAEQVVAKALLPLVDPVSTDQTVNSANVPWMFSMAPTDPDLATWLCGQLGSGEFVLLAATDHDSRNLATEFIKCSRRLNRVPLRRIDFNPGLVSAEPIVAQAVDAQSAVILAPAADTAALVRAIPEATHLLAGPSASSRRFRELAGSAAARVSAPVLCKDDGELLSRLERRFSQPADAFSLLAYAAAAQLIAAIRQAGLNRSLIRDSLAAHFGPTGRRLQTISSSIDSRADGAPYTDHGSHRRREASL